MTGRAALRIALPLALLAVLWRLADGPAALALLARADPVWLAVALAALHAQVVLSAWRWERVAAALGAPLPRGRAVPEYYVAQLLNATLPGGVAGDGARALRARAGQGGLPRAAAAVVVERLAGQIALGAALAGGLALSVAVPVAAWPAGLRPVVALVLGALVLVLAFVLVARRPAWAAAAGAALRRALFARGQIGPQAALGAAIFALNILSFAAAARATGTALSPLAALILGALVLSAMLVPLSVGGWGWREGAAAALFPLFGATAAAGLAAGVAHGLLMLAAALPGLLWLWPARSPSADPRPPPGAGIAAPARPAIIPIRNGEPE